MKGRLCALFLLLMLLLLAACGSAEDPGWGTDPQDTREADGREGIVVEPTDTEVSAGTPEPTPEPTPIPVMAPIGLDEVPEGLDAFLIRFDYGYSDREGGKEFDCENCVDVRANLLAQLVTSASCADFSLYPGEQPVFHWNDGSHDPQGWDQETGFYAEFDPEQVAWVAENIFHISETEYRALLGRCMNSNTFYAARNQAGQERFFVPIPAVDGPNTLVRYESAQFDGSRYEIVYHNLMEPSYYLDSYLAVVEQREIDGQLYWTLLRQTEEIPEPEPEDAPELFGLLIDSFYLDGDFGAWRTELTILEDGSFSGRYQETAFGDSGEGYDETIYYADFEGRFTHPQKINPYTYSIELDELRYLDRMEDVIAEEEDGWRILYRYATAVGVEGGRIFYVYMPGAPFYKLPESFRAWYLGTAALDGDPLELPTWGMMNGAGGQGFATLVIR